VCRFELSLEDRNLLKGMQEAVLQQGGRMEELMQQVLHKLDVDHPSQSDLREMRRELIAVDMEAKDRDYMEQICTLLERTVVVVPTDGKRLCLPCRPHQILPCYQGCGEAFCGTGLGSASSGFGKARSACIGLNRPIFLRLVPA
jgi:hypothetical protein